MGVESDDTTDGVDESDDGQIPSSDTDIDSTKEPGERVIEKSPRGRFIRFNRRLGAGAYKVVYLAFDTDVGREVAWNVVPFRRLDRHARKLIESEIKLASSLDSPRILKFVSSWVNRDKGEVVFITERITGGSLWSYINRLSSPLKMKVIRKWSREILEGLVYLHTHDPHPIIHRDLKCSNIFVNGGDGNVVIGDLGLCTTLLVNQATSLVGTPEFMAPEVYDESYGTAVDIYAFGMCLLQMIARRLPYAECSSAAQVYKKVITGIQPVDVSRMRNEELRRIVELCIQTNPVYRPTAVQLLGNSFWTRREGGDELADIVD